MDPDRSSMIRISGGSGMIPTFIWPQLMPAAPPAPVRMTSPPGVPADPPPEVPALPDSDAPPAPAMGEVPKGVAGAKLQPTIESNRTRRTCLGDRRIGTSENGHSDVLADPTNATTDMYPLTGRIRQPDRTSADPALSAHAGYW